MAVPEDFKKMIDEDIENLMDALSDVSNSETLEYAKVQLYKEITAKYHPYVPKLSDGLYGYLIDFAFYEEVSDESLRHNLYQVCNKLKSFKAAGYPSLISINKQGTNNIVLNANNEIHNSNENNNVINISFEQVRQQIEDMSSLPDSEIEEILNRVNELEKIVQSSERRTKKWENAKDIIKWMADKGVDVGIALLPLLLQIK